VSWFPSYVSVLLVQSKMSLRGVSVKIFRSGAPVCPVELLREAWVGAPLSSAADPLLQDDQGLPLSYRTLLHFIKQQVREFGFDPAAFGAHSLRIGGASQLAASNLPATHIQALGRWTSECYQRYIRLPDSSFERASASLAASMYGP